MKTLLWFCLWITVLLIALVSFWYYALSGSCAVVAIIIYRHVANYIDSLPD